MKFFVLITILYFVYGLVDEQQVVDEIFERDKCETCCRVLFATVYDPSNGFSEISKSSQTQYVMDVEFETYDMIRMDINAYNTQQMRIRKLEVGRELQFWEFASYQMFCLYSYPNRVMDILYNTIFGSPLIIWRRKAPLNPNTNNQRFTYIYDYEFMDSRHKPYAKAFIAEYYQKVDNCYDDWQYCETHNSYDYLGAEMCYEISDYTVERYCGSLYNYYQCGNDVWRMNAYDCKIAGEGSYPNAYKKQKFIPIFA
ncbi:Galactose-inhibitable lectin 35 kDa subunit [Entamoeba marina]